MDFNTQSNGLKLFFKEDYDHNVPHVFKRCQISQYECSIRSYKNAGYIHENTNAPPKRVSMYCGSTYYLVNTAAQEKPIMYSCV